MSVSQNLDHKIGQYFPGVAKTTPKYGCWTFLGIHFSKWMAGFGSLPSIYYYFLDFWELAPKTTPHA
jgi:hypothetical protein